ncbi:MAG: radical SAM protein [Opitutales bacterium]|nr:radical SAM protein [Opitutales bacterium]
MDVDNIFLDIGDVCNSKCLFCSTGIKNRNGCSSEERGSFMNFEFFKQVWTHLKEVGFIHTPKDQRISLYNWGEPLLHPEFERIIDYLTQEKRKIVLSTNGIYLPKFSANVNASSIRFIRFTMCGFSQASYDKIFMADFEQCKRNIATLVKNLRAHHGYIGGFGLIFCVYQFNTHEIQAAAEFARSLHIDFWPVWAYQVDGKRGMQFLKGELPTEYLSKMFQYLFYGGHKRGPVNTCHFAQLCINPRGGVHRCCMFRESMGSIFDMTPDSWKALCDSYPFCTECKAAGFPRLLCEDDDEFDLRALKYYL